MTPQIKQRIEQICRGEVPDGYKKTKAGVIPNEWELCMISDCLEKVDNPVSVEPDALYTQIGIRSHGKGLFYKDPVTGKELGNKSVFWIEPNCFVLNIVFAWEQAFGKTTNNEVGMIASHRFPMYRPINNSVYLDYLICYFLTKRGTDILDAASPGGAGRNRTLGQDRFVKSKIMRPPLDEQKKIAEILSAQDKLIALKEKLIEEKKCLKKALMQYIFSSDNMKDYTQLKLCAFMKESKVIAIPNIEKRLTVKLNLQGVEKRKVRTTEKENATVQYIRRSGQFIYGKQNFHHGAFGIVPDLLDGYQSSSDIPSFDIFNKNISVKWIYYWFSRKEIYESLEVLTSGTGSKRLNPETFLKIKIPVPEKNIQEKIIKIFDLVDNEIILLEKNIEQEKQKKKAMMQLLLTGIVRV